MADFESNTMWKNWADVEALAQAGFAQPGTAAEGANAKAADVAAALVKNSYIYREVSSRIPCSSFS